MTGTTAQPEFDDQGRLLLPDTVYEPVLGPTGRRIGWRVPDAERHIWDALALQHAEHRGVYAKSQIKRVPAEPKPLADLVEELNEWVIDFGYQLEQDLADAYKNDAAKVTQIVRSIIQGCETQRIHSPGGVLRSRLNELRSNGQADSLG